MVCVYASWCDMVDVQTMRETKGVLEKLEAQAAKDKQELQGTPCTHHTTDGSSTTGLTYVWVMVWCWWYDSRAGLPQASGAGR